ncbi:hypothetical protein ABIC16_000939 [Sphingomonas sp. PvP055]|uniref:CC0125/CC1285 family lipoprotein n=1 Tax=Sphingomonas sp. PvP055 TaxID=3156391 RepID=UPI0033926284
MKAFVLFAIVVSVSGCVTAAPSYQAAAGPGGVGYYASPAADGRMTVTYTGAESMPSEQVARFAFLRAAELTVAAGQPVFAVLETRTHQVEASRTSSLSSRAGPNLSGGSVSAGTGSPGDQSGGAPGVSSPSVPTGPSTGGFGGGDVPYQMLERWQPRQVNQTVLLVQMAADRETLLRGQTNPPQIFAAKDVIAEITPKK